MTAPRVLVAGIGNLFFADDGFGCEVATRLSTRALPEGVRVEDYGTRGMHLAYELLDGYDALILIDAVPLGEPAGTIALIEPEPSEPARFDQGQHLDAHAMNPDVVLGTLSHLGGHVGRIVIVGCQPGVIEPAIGLSPAVEAAVDPAVTAVGELMVEVVEQLSGTTQEVRT